MRAHLSIGVKDVSRSVVFYSKVFGQSPQKQTSDYAKYDLKSPALNFSLVASGEVSRVNHLGVEVDSTKEFEGWLKHLEAAGVPFKPEINSDCCFARQDKLWFADPDGNPWEIFFVHEQLPVVPGKGTGSECCVR